MTREPTLSALELELLAADEPNPTREAKLTPETQASLAALRSQNEAFRAAHDVDVWRLAFDQKLAAHHNAPPPSDRTSWLSRLRWTGSVLAMACLALVWFREPPVSSLEEAPATTRTKGDLRLGLRVGRIVGTTYQPMSSGDVSHPGDVVQIQVEGPLERTEMMVFSIDGRGSITLHYPKHPGEALAVNGMLPRSFELDDAPDFERFFLVSAARLPVAAVLQEAQKMAKRPELDQVDIEFPTHFPPDMAQSTFLLRKEVP